MSTITITATKTVNGKLNKKTGVVTEQVESFGKCAQRMRELGKAWVAAGFTLKPVSRVDFQATGVENGKMVHVLVIARYDTKESKIVAPTGATSITVTKKVLATTAN